MTNADTFKAEFGLYATEIWAMSEKEFLYWLNSKYQVPATDCISRQAVLDRIERSVEEYGNQYTTDMLNMWGLFTEFIKSMPPILEPINYKCGHKGKEQTE